LQYCGFGQGTFKDLYHRRWYLRACLLNAYNGVRLIEPQLYDVVRMGGNRRDEILRLFSAASRNFAGLQISLSCAWTCVLAEPSVPVQVSVLLSSSA
jgi:hypothetical protein